MSAVDNDLLETLTPEERAAIEDVDPAEAAALQRIADGAADPDDDPDDETDEAAQQQGSTDTGAQPPAPAAAPAPAPAAVAPVAQAATPAYKAELPADFAAQKDAIDTQFTELREKFRAGEIELDAYEEQRAALDQQRDALRKAELKAEISQEMSAQTAEQQWASAIASQFNAALKPENGGIDYQSDDEKRGDLDGFVRQLAGRPENAARPMDWFLSEAHRRVLALHGVQATSAAPKTDPVKDAVDKRRPAVGAVPPSVAHVPGAEGAGDLRDEFAELDSLDGVELEAALARLSPAQREKYAKGG